MLWFGPFDVIWKKFEAKLKLNYHFVTVSPDKDTPHPTSSIHIGFPILKFQNVCSIQEHTMKRADYSLIVIKNQQRIFFLCTFI